MSLHLTLVKSDREREIPLNRPGSILRKTRSSYLARKLSELASRFEIKKWRDQIHAGEVRKHVFCDFPRNLYTDGPGILRWHIRQPLPHLFRNNDSGNFVVQKLGL